MRYRFSSNLHPFGYYQQSCFLLMKYTGVSHVCSFGCLKFQTMIIVLIHYSQ